MPAKNWWFKFEYRIWRTAPELRRCSLETRAFWLEVLCVMHESDTDTIEGSYEELGWLIGCAPDIIARCAIELQRTKTADVTLGNGNVTLVSRRLKRELNTRKQTRSRVQKHRNAECNADVTAQSKSKSNNKSKTIDAYASIDGGFAAGRQDNGSIPTDFGYPIQDLLSAFPDLVLTPAQCGQIESTVTIQDRAAWSATIKKYQLNHNPALKQYLPQKVGNLLGVFQDEKQRLEREQNRNNNQRSEREKSAERGFNAVTLIDELRRQGQEISGGDNGHNPQDAILIESSEPH